MKIKKTKFKGLLVIENKRFIDSRGEFRELIVEKNLKIRFPFNVISKSKKNVIRGLHYQVNEPQGKFISVIKGEILDVALDLRKNSKTFGKHYKIVLIYSCTNYREASYERGILWNDPELKINWKIKKPILSKKDKNNPKFNLFF